MASDKKVSKKKNILLVAGLLVLSFGVGLFVFTLLTKESTVTLNDSARPLTGSELPSEEKPSQQDLAEYKTEDAYPRKFIISRLGIAARIVPLSKDKNGVIESPANIFDVGWLKTTAKADDSEGFMVIDGHVQGASKAGVFKTLDTIKVGDGIVVTQGNGKDISFSVTSLKLVSYDEAAETSLLAPPKKGTFELRLITCAGVYSKDKKTYEKRLIVTAARK